MEELEWGELTSELSFSLLWYRLLCIVTILKLLPSSKIGIPCTTTLPTRPFLYWLPFCLLFGLFSPSFGWNMLSGCFLRKVAQELNFRDLFLFKEKKKSVLFSYLIGSLTGKKFPSTFRRHFSCLWTFQYSFWRVWCCSDSGFLFAYFFWKHSFTWLLQVLVVACRIFSLHCGMNDLLVGAHGIFSCIRWDLVSWPGMEPGSCALGVRSLSHWTTREVSVQIPGPFFFLVCVILIFLDIFCLYWWW